MGVVLCCVVLCCVLRVLYATQCCVFRWTCINLEFVLCCLFGLLVNCQLVALHSCISGVLIIL